MVFKMLSSLQDDVRFEVQPHEAGVKSSYPGLMHVQERTLTGCREWTAPTRLLMSTPTSRVA